MFLKTFLETDGFQSSSASLAVLWLAILGMRRERRLAIWSRKIPWLSLGHKNTVRVVPKLAFHFPLLTPFIPPPYYETEDRILCALQRRWMT